MTKEEIELIFGKGIVKSIYVSPKDKVNKGFEFKLDTNTETNSGIYDDDVDGKYSISLLDAGVTYIEFTNGKKIKINISEWGCIWSVD